MDELSEEEMFEINQSLLKLQIQLAALIQQQAEDRKQQAEDRKQQAEDRKQQAEDRNWVQQQISQLTALTQQQAITRANPTEFERRSTAETEVERRFSFETGNNQSSSNLKCDLKLEFPKSEVSSTIAPKMFDESPKKGKLEFVIESELKVKIGEKQDKSEYEVVGEDYEVHSTIETEVFVLCKIPDEQRKVLDCVHDTYKLDLEGNELAYDSRIVLTFGAFPRVKLKLNVLFENFALIRNNGNCSPDHANEKGLTCVAIDFLNASASLLAFVYSLDYVTALDLKSRAAGGTETPWAQTTNLTAVGEGRETVLSLKLNKLSNSVSGLTVVDPKGYLTDLKNVKITSDAETSDINKARLLLRLVIQINLKHSIGWITTAIAYGLDKKSTSIGEKKVFIFWFSMVAAAIEHVSLLTIEDNQPGGLIQVFEGERTRAKDNNLLERSLKNFVIALNYQSHLCCCWPFLKVDSVKIDLTKTTCCYGKLQYLFKGLFMIFPLFQMKLILEPWCQLSNLVYLDTQSWRQVALEMWEWLAFIFQRHCYRLYSIWDPWYTCSVLDLHTSHSALKIFDPGGSMVHLFYVLPVQQEEDGSCSNLRTSLLRRGLCYSINTITCALL